MHISFSPQRRDDTLTLEKTGDRLRINGRLFNFNSLADGDEIPAGDIPCEWILGTVHRIDGEIRLKLILPHGPSPSDAVAFPDPIFVEEDGPISVPHDLSVSEILEMLNGPDLSAEGMSAIYDRAQQLGIDIPPPPTEDATDVDA
jgi:hypothetical protein